MPALKPISRKKFVRRLKYLGFDGPFAGGKHLYMIKGNKTLTIPNPHRQDIGVNLLKQILKQAGISLEDWENA